MALEHEFCLLPKIDKKEKLTYNLIKEMAEEIVKIDDELILYLNDSLNWVNSIINAKESNGISYYGITIFQEENIVKLKNVILKWSELFILAPEEIKITGEYDEKNKKYKIIKLNKKNTCQSLKKLSELLEMAKDEEKVIVYMGI